MKHLFPGTIATMKMFMELPFAQAESDPRFFQPVKASSKEVPRGNLSLSSAQQSAGTHSRQQPHTGSIIIFIYLDSF